MLFDGGDDSDVPMKHDAVTVCRVTLSVGLRWIKCTPVAEKPKQLGEACTVMDNGMSELDDCDLGLMCFGAFDADLEGICVEQCSAAPVVSPLIDAPRSSCRSALMGGSNSRPPGESALKPEQLEFVVCVMASTCRGTRC